MEFIGPEHEPVPQLLAYHAQAAQRRSAWRPASAEEQKLVWGYPIAFAVVLAAVAFLILRRARRPKAV